MSETLKLTLIVGVFSLGSSIVTLVLGYFIRRLERRDDRVERERVARLLEASTAKADEHAQEVTAQLTRVEETGAITHTLVNSDKTAQMEENLASARRELIKSNELIDLRKSFGQQPTQAILEDVEVIRARIAELEVDLTKRHATNGVVEQRAGRAEP